MSTERAADQWSIGGHNAARRRFAGLLFAAALLGLCGQAQAQVLYSCKGRDGKRYDSDQIPPECDGQTIHRRRRDGTPLDDIQPDPTPAERKKHEDEEKRKLDEKEQKRAQDLKDRSLLETYCSVEEIEAARTRAVAAQQIVVDRAVGRKTDLQKERKHLDDEAEFYTKRDLPENLKRGFASNNESMKLQDEIIKKARGEVERVKQLFDGYKNRFQELIGQGLTPCGGRKAK